MRLLIGLIARSSDKLQIRIVNAAESVIRSQSCRYVCGLAIKQRMILIAMIQETRCNRTSESGPSPFPKSDANHLQLRIALNNKAIAIVAKPVLDDIVWS